MEGWLVLFMHRNHSTLPPCFSPGSDRTPQLAKHLAA